MAKFIAYTKRKEIANLAFEWNIEKFGEKMDTFITGEAVELDVTVGETKWSFKVYPNGSKSKIKKAVSLYFGSQNETETTARVKMSIIDTSKNSTQPTENQERKVYMKREFTHTFEDEDDKLRGYPLFLKHKEVKNKAKFLLKGSLVLRINITVLGEEKTTKHSPDHDFQEIEKQEKLKFTERMKDSWKTDDFSDVHVMCNGEIFYCHRMILARSSAYFRGMLESGLQESQIQVIHMDHMDVDILRAIVKFIYGGEMDNLEVNAVDLLKASNMLILEDLKNICEKYLLAKYMKVENVIDLLVMAAVHNASVLKKGAMEMIATNSGAIVKQVGWREKLSDTPILALEIIEAMASSNEMEEESEENESEENESDDEENDDEENDDEEEDDDEESDDDED